MTFADPRPRTADEASDDGERGVQGHLGEVTMMVEPVSSVPLTNGQHV